MSATHFIRRFISGLPKDRIFTTRDCLMYGKRSAVDYALFALVKKEVIIRLARGVFVRNYGKTPELSPLLVATIKAKAFGKQLITDASQLTRKLNDYNKSSQKGNTETFAVDGPTSSFNFGNTKIHLKHIGPRKMQLGESKAGQAARVLWHLGKDNLNKDTVRKVIASFLGADRETIHHVASYVPAWVSSHFMRPLRWYPSLSN